GLLAVLFHLLQQGADGVHVIGVEVLLGEGRRLVGGVHLDADDDVRLAGLEVLAAKVTADVHHDGKFRLRKRGRPSSEAGRWAPPSDSRRPVRPARDARPVYPSVAGSRPDVKRKSGRQVAAPQTRRQGDKWSRPDRPARDLSFTLSPCLLVSLSA